jgi:hypothetical protein
MAVFVVSYDLRKPGRDYQPLWNRLGEWKAVRGLQSLWFINWNTTAVAIRDDLAKHIDPNDGLFVGRVPESAWKNLQGQSGQTLSGWYSGR